MLLLTACGGQELGVSNAPQEGILYYIPPTLSKKASPIELDTPTPPPANPTPDCENNLIYIEDITVPDGAEFAPGANIEKVWKVENAGTCNWEAGFNIRFVSGNLMGTDDTQVLFPARAGSEVEIRIIFTAPRTPGRYTTFWQGFGPDGNSFGEAFYMDIIVNPDLSATETPTLEAEEKTTPEATSTEKEN